MHPPVEVIAGQGAKGRHLKVGVRVDASGHDQLAACINDTGVMRSLRPGQQTFCEALRSRTRWTIMIASVSSNRSPAGLGLRRR